MNAPSFGFVSDANANPYTNSSSLRYRPSFQPSPPDAHALPRPSFSQSNQAARAGPRKSTSELWGMPAAEANQVVSERMLGGGCQKEDIMTERSPYSDEYDSDEMDEDVEADDDEEYEEENSFDGPLKEEYRGRAWSQSQDQQPTQYTQQQQQEAVVHRQQQVIEQQQYQAHQLQQQASADAYAAQARWNAQQEALAAANALAARQQYEAHQAALAANVAPRDLDRLFHNIRPSTFPAAAPEPTFVAAPTAPKPTPSSLPLAPFAAEAIWSLLQNPFSPQAAEKATAVVTDDSVSYDRVAPGEFGGWDEWTGASLKTPTASQNGRWEGVGKKAGYNAWEEERWAKDPYSASQHTPPPLTLDDFSASYNMPALPLRQNPYNLPANPPQSFVRFAHQTLAQTLISPTGVMLALWYVSRSALHEGGGDEGRGFREGLRRCSNGEEVAKRVLTLGLAWANKWLDDNTFTNRSWSDVTRLPVEEINHLELLALSTISFDLTVTISDWSSWIHRLHTSTADPTVRAALVEMAENLRDSEDKWAVSSAGQGAEFEAAREEQRVQQLEQQRQQQEAIRASAAQLAQQQQQQQTRAHHRSSSNRTSFPPPPTVAPSTYPYAAPSAPISSTISYHHPHPQQAAQHQQQQRPQLSLRAPSTNTLAAAAAAARALPYPAPSSRYNGQAGVCTGGLLPSVQQGFGQVGMPVGRCW